MTAGSAEPDRAFLGIFRRRAVEAVEAGDEHPRPVGLGGGRRPRRVPVVTQGTAIDCAAACLAMVLGAFGRATPLAEAREALGSGRDGATAADLCDAAAELGLEAQGYRADVDDLAALDLPAILHWRFDHFVVLERIRRGRYVIVDPARGRVAVGREEMERSFTGVAIAFEPTERLEPRRPATPGWRRYLGFALEQRGRLAAVAAASAVLLALGLVMPLVTAHVIDRVIPARSFSALGTLAVGVAAYVAAHAGVTLLRSELLVRLQAAMDRRMTTSFFRTLLELPLSFFHLRSTGDLLMRLSSNAVVRNALSQQLVSVTLDTVLMASYLVAMFAVEPGLALVAVAVAAAQLAIAVVSVQLVKPLSDREVSAQARSRAYAVEAAQRRRLEELGRAGAGLAHQLRTPLATIKGSCQLVAEEVGQGTARRRLEAALEQVRRMERMLGLLLDFARPPQAEPERVALGPLLEELASRWERVSVRVDGRCVAWADREHLLQILENLVDNALAVSPEGAVVEIEARCDRDRVVVTVADRGPGPGDDPEELFKPYVTHRADGSGLGLPIARNLAEANGGTLELRPRPGGGTEAVLRLRVARGG